MGDIGTWVPMGILLKMLADLFTKVMGRNTRWWAEVFGSRLQLVLGSVLPGSLSGSVHPLLVPPATTAESMCVLQALSLLGTMLFSAKGCWS